jgi:hypothetical protein
MAEPARALGKQQHGYRGRVRSGCLTCRSRKIRCDELRPICDNCTKFGKRPCVYKSKRLQRPSATTLDSQKESGHTSEIREISRTNCSVSPTSSVLKDQSDLLEPLRHAIATPSEDLHNGILSPDIPMSWGSSLRRPNDMSIKVDDIDFDSISPSTLISRDIKLTTTMDFLTAGEVPLQLSFSFFAETVDFPPITPFDTVNWQQFKLNAIDLGMSNSAVASAIIAISALYKAQSYGLPLSNALALHEASHNAYEKSLNDENHHFSTTLVATFLLCLFQFVHYEAVPHLQKPGEEFLRRLRHWAEDISSHSELSSRIIIWLRILHATTIRGGGVGLISDSVCSLLPPYKAGTPNLTLTSNYRSDTSTQLIQTLSISIFEFYFQLQVISGEIAKLTHYHRSRTTGMDQEEVVQQVELAKNKLHALYKSRSATQSQTPKDLRCHLAPQIANSLISLIGLCTAAYHAEFVELDRLLGDPVSKSTEARQAMDRIQEIIDGDWNVYDEDKLNSGYLRPLFLYAIECMDHHQNHWAVEKLRQIKSPICRSDFFASFGKALSDAQLRKDRRVTSKYFCIWYFGVPPPFI